MSSVAEQIATLTTRLDRVRAELDATQAALQAIGASDIKVEGRLSGLESRVGTIENQVSDLNRDRRAVIYAVFAAVGASVLAAIGWSGDGK